MAAIPVLWRTHSIEFVPFGGTALTSTNLTIAAISNQRLVANATVQKDIPSNKTFPQNGRIEFGAWDLEITTMAARRVISGFGNALAACIGGASPNLDSVVLYLAAYDCDGQLASSSHRAYTIQKGAAFLTSMQSDHRGDLGFTFRVAAVRGAAGDANAAVVLTTGSALPSEAQIENGGYDQYERFTLGDDTDTLLHNTAVGGKRSISVDFGPSLRTEGADSDIADSILLIESFSPVVTATGIEPTWFSHLTAGGLKLGIEGAQVDVAAGATAAIFKFRKRSGAGFTTEAGNWLQMAMSGIAHYSEPVAQTGLEPATAAVQIDVIQDSATGVNGPIQFTPL